MSANGNVSERFRRTDKATEMAEVDAPMPCGVGVDSPTPQEALEKEIDNLLVRNEDLAASVERESGEKAAYRQVATLAESNELTLHRKLSQYVEEEMSRLRARNKALEGELANLSRKPGA